MDDSLSEHMNISLVNPEQSGVCRNRTEESAVFPHNPEDSNHGRDHGLIQNSHPRQFKKNDRVTDFQRLHLRSGSALAHTIADDGSLVVVYGEGGGCTLDTGGDTTAIFLPLWGTVQVATSAIDSTLHRCEVLVTEPDSHIKAVGQFRARWVALLGGMRAWSRMLGGGRSGLASGTQLLPACHVANANLQRHAIAVARAGVDSAMEYSINAVIDSIISLQMPLEEAVTRCPGRTHAKRLGSFLRLQRVRNHIRNCCDQNLDNRTLARMANYDPCHFLRIFAHVFGETPRACLVNQRLQRAQRLLRLSDMSITEVAAASGFGNRSSFSRLFHKRFGTTANSMSQLKSGS